uniref:Uncharacterized protein n=2 Tax=Aegilops tauschii subsp. strangulata TaxID=200361 RepID=A0A453SB90_AEGTS
LQSNAGRLVPISRVSSPPTRRHIRRSFPDPRNAFLPPSPNPHLPSPSISFPPSPHRRQAQPRRVYDAQADIEPLGYHAGPPRGLHPPVDGEQHRGGRTAERCDGLHFLSVGGRGLRRQRVSSRSDATGARVAARRLPPR